MATSRSASADIAVVLPALVTADILRDIFMDARILDSTTVTAFLDINITESPGGRVLGGDGEGLGSKQAWVTLPTKEWAQAVFATLFRVTFQHPTDPGQPYWWVAVRYFRQVPSTR